MKKRFLNNRKVYKKLNLFHKKYLIKKYVLILQKIKKN